MLDFGIDIMLIIMESDWLASTGKCSRPIVQLTPKVEDVILELPGVRGILQKWVDFDSLQ